MMFMVLVKLFELRTGKDFVFVVWRNKIDKHVHLWFAKIKKFIVAKEQSLIYLIKNIPLKVLYLVSVVHIYLHKKYGKHVDMIKGRSIPTNKGNVSFFVNSISEYKKEVKR
jgi:hypothetical protein